jgi:hypothetical protein
LQANPVSFTLEQFKCFEDYFKFYNSKGMFPNIAHAFYEKYLEVRSLDLSGIDNLWNIIFKCLRTDVFLLASEFLIMLHLKLSRDFLTKRKNQLAKFVDTCMSRLKSALSLGEVNVESVKLECSRAMQTLRLFLKACKDYAADLEKDNSFGTKKELIEDLSHPKQLLSNDQTYFDTLLNLLKVGGSLGRDIWELLESLPRNDAIYNSIVSLGNSKKPENLEALLDSKSILRLLYSLQIIQNICKETNEEAINWKNKACRERNLPAFFREKL